MRIANFALISSLFLYAGIGLVAAEALSDESAPDPQRASEIYQSIVARLDDAYPESKESVWSEGAIDLESKWIVQTPEGLWGKSKEELPGDFVCAAGDRNCDPAFLRVRCDVDDDCASSRTHCAPLEASVWRLGQKPTKMCQGPSDHLIDDMYRVMVSAERELDFVSLSLPTEEFYTAFINALSVLSERATVPKIRLLFAGKNPTSLNLFITTDRVMNEIMNDVRSLQPRNSDRLKMNLAWLSDGKRISWNHAKIIVADGAYALTGGHNLWGKHYLSATPLFDLSLLYRGEAATGARNFVNALWNHVGTRWSSYPSDLGLFTPFRIVAPMVNTVKNTISVGRMGSFGENVSDEALRAMIDSARSSLYISQQDLYNQVRTPATQSFAFDSIIDAAMRGVQIKIVQSNKFHIGGFGAVKGESAYRGLLNAMVGRLIGDRGYSLRSAEDVACKTIRYASIRFSKQLSPWPKTGNPIGNHTKFVMVDDSAFYIGSHNLYPANLQEFGTMIADSSAAAELKAEYWDKVWDASAPESYPCPF